MVTGMVTKNSFLSALVFAVCFGITVVESEPCHFNYIVLPGDTCDGIAAKERVTSQEIVNLNNGTLDCNSLEIGQAICLLSSSDVDCEPVYLVKSEDTSSCASIASKNNVTVNYLFTQNPTLNCDKIYRTVGAVICIGSDFGIIAVDNGTATFGPITANTSGIITTATSGSTVTATNTTL